MDNLSRHPESGLHYLHYIPDSPAYRDFLESYRLLARKVPWLSAEPLDGWGRIWNSANSRDPSLFVIVWGKSPDPPPPNRSERRCNVVLFYGETVGDPAEMHDDQKRVLIQLIRDAPRYDAVWVHAPSAADFLRSRFGIKSDFVPAGYEPVVFGHPDFECEKSISVVFYGALLGRRAVLPGLKAVLGKKLVHVDAAYGAKRHSVLNAARIILHVPHCGPSASFASFRLWQAIGSSAALATESVDAWPAVAGRHYFELPQLVNGNEARIASRLIEILDSNEPCDVSRRVNEVLSVYSPLFCMEKFAVPNSERIS